MIPLICEGNWLPVTPEEKVQFLTEIKGVVVDCTLFGQRSNCITRDLEKHKDFDERVKNLIKPEVCITNTGPPGMGKSHTGNKILGYDFLESIGVYFENAALPVTLVPVLCVPCNQSRTTPYLKRYFVSEAEYQKRCKELDKVRTTSTIKFGGSVDVDIDWEDEKMINQVKHAIKSVDEVGALYHAYFELCYDFKFLAENNLKYLEV